LNLLWLKSHCYIADATSVVIVVVVVERWLLDRAAAAAEGPSLCFALPFFIYLFKLVAVRSKFDRRERETRQW